MLSSSSAQLLPTILAYLRYKQTLSEDFTQEWKRHINLYNTKDLSEVATIARVVEKKLALTEEILYIEDYNTYSK